MSVNCKPGKDDELVIYYFCVEKEVLLFGGFQRLCFSLIPTSRLKCYVEVSLFFGVDFDFDLGTFIEETREGGKKT